MSRAGCCLLLLLLAAVGPAGAAPRAGYMTVQGVGDAGAAARQAAAMTGGRVLDVQSRMAAGQPLYLVRVLLPDGRVRVVQVQGAALPARGFGPYGN